MMGLTAAMFIFDFGKTGPRDEIQLWGDFEEVGKVYEAV